MNFEPGLATFGNPWVPGVILVHLYVIFFAGLALTARRLPERVTTQFGLSGRPGTQMRRGIYLIFMTVCGVWFPLFNLILTSILGAANRRGVNIPRRDYWMASERVAETRAYLLAHSLWFACLALAFLFGLHFVLVRANRQQPARLPWPLLLPLVGFFIGGILLWETGLFRHFARPGG
jgi:ABC-type Fe3+ transport system permease subunit